MQVTETSSDGLKRQLRVTVGAGEIGTRFNSRVDEIRGTIQIKGFRKGHVPTAHIKKLYGRSLMAEVLQQAVDETSRKALAERDERPAVQPKIELPENEEEIEKVLSGQSDLAYSMSFEVLPKFEIADLAGLKLEKLVADVDPAQVDKAIAELAERNTSYTAEEGRAAEDGDRLTVDFVGKIDGVAFEGGTGEGISLVLGKDSFIPGFAEGMKGLKAGEQKVIEATFPADYAAEQLKGKTAHFDVTIKEVAKPSVPAIDDELAKSLGAESLERLKELVSQQILREHEQASRGKLKKQLLDVLDQAHTFPLPASLVDGEFDAIWRQVTQGMESAKRTFADEGKTEEQARDEYRKIAERRVRLGLVVGEIGDKNKIEVSQDDLRRALMEQARRFPGQERMVYEYYEKTPGAIAELRAPIFEEKVVDYIIALATPVERKVSREELFKPDPDETT